jgi:hypothetical protein
MKPVTHYPFVNHRNILSSPPHQGGFFAPGKNNFKNQGTTERSELDATNK